MIFRQENAVPNVPAFTFLSPRLLRVEIISLLDYENEKLGKLAAFLKNLNRSFWRLLSEIITRTRQNWLERGVDIQQIFSFIVFGFGATHTQNQRKDPLSVYGASEFPHFLQNFCPGFQGLPQSKQNLTSTTSQLVFSLKKCPYLTYNFFEVSFIFHL